MPNNAVGRVKNVPGMLPSLKKILGPDGPRDWCDSGRSPTAVFGNCDGDLQMLQYTAAGKSLRFCLYVHHTDSEREWVYDRQSHIGRLDKGLDEAKAKGWTLVSMKGDWKKIYPK